MQSNDISVVRQYLLNALQDVCDTSKTVDKERVNAICDVAQAIVDTAKVEVEYIKATNYIGTGFLETADSSKDVRTKNKQLGGAA